MLLKKKSNTLLEHMDKKGMGSLIRLSSISHSIGYKEQFVRTRYFLALHGQPSDFTGKCIMLNFSCGKLNICC